jgi:hypothetical protein
MWEVVFLVVCLLLLALHWTTRERLEPTGNIIAPVGGSTYSEEQKAQIWSNLPESVRASYQAYYAGTADPASEVSNKLGSYYSRFYAPLSHPPTPEDIDQWMMDICRTGNARERELLIAYFVDGFNVPPPPPPAAETPPPPGPGDNPSASAVPVPPEPAPASVTSTPQPVPTTPEPMELRSPTNITINVR